MEERGREEGKRLMDEGKALCEKGAFSEAIEKYTQVLQSKVVDDARDAEVHWLRSHTYCQMCDDLRSRPAQASERHALFGFDIHQIAEMALSDAEKACKFAQTAEHLHSLGRACYLLEDYERSREAYSRGLSCDPSDHVKGKLEESLREVEKLLSGRKGSVSGSALEMSSTEFECSLCFRLFCDPVTTVCGHTFCKTCLLRSQDYGNRCPACRTVLFITQSKLCVNVTLKAIIEKHFPEEYAKRVKEETAKRVEGDLGKAMIPLFVMDVVLPHQKMALNIFEPRYRLLIRRAMSGSRSFGMIGLSGRSRDVLDVGCEVQIEECNCLPDGRFQIEVVGTRRFRVNKCEEQDGYRLAHAEYFQDSSEAPTTSVNDLFALAREVDDKMENFLDKIRQRNGEQSAVLHALMRSTGKKPSIQACRPDVEISETDPSDAALRARRAKWCEEVSFYVGIILSLIQQVDPASLIQFTSTKSRLTLLNSSPIL